MKTLFFFFFFGSSPEFWDKSVPFAFFLGVFTKFPHLNKIVVEVHPPQCSTKIGTTGRNRHGLFLRAEKACPDVSKFESFILLVPLVFELELFKPKIGISFFGWETRIT